MRKLKSICKLNLAHISLLNLNFYYAFINNYHFIKSAFKRLIDIDDIEGLNCSKNMLIYSFLNRIHIYI